MSCSLGREVVCPRDGTIPAISLPIVIIIPLNTQEHNILVPGDIDPTLLIWFFFHHLLFNSLTLRVVCRSFRAVSLTLHHQDIVASRDYLITKWSSFISHHIMWIVSCCDYSLCTIDSSLFFSQSASWKFEAVQNEWSSRDSMLRKGNAKG